MRPGSDPARRSAPTTMPIVPAGEPEPLDRRARPERLVWPLGCCSARPRRRSPPGPPRWWRTAVVPDEELGFEGLVEPLDLAGRGRRPRARSAGGGSRSRADPVERHRPRPGPYLPVNTFPLSVRICSGTPWRRSASAKRLTHRPRGGPDHQLGAHHEPRVVVDPGHDLHLATRRPGGPRRPRPSATAPSAGTAPNACSRPADVAALGGIDQPVAHQRPVDRRPPRHRIDARPARARSRIRSGPHDRMRPPQRQHPRLDLRRHLVRTRPRP